jgi:alkylation response protein AidB-like acyl-CoA dehydrogenase
LKFHLDEQQTALQASVSRLLERELDTARLMAAVDGADGHDAALWQALGDLGVFGIAVPEAYGGLGLGILETAIVAEVLGAHAVPGPFLAHTLATLAIAEGGSPAQRERWLPGLASGARIGTIAVGEPGDVWQPDEWRVADAERLDGTKTHVPYPRQADVLVVGVAGGGLRLVEDLSAGVTVEALSSLDATRRTAHVHLRDVPAQPLDARAARLRDAALVLLAADAFGGARRCVDMAVDYALTREQFGTVIAGFQAVKHQLANMATDAEPARALYWYAAHATDAGLPDAPRMAALAKAHLGEVYLQAARDATEVHGGIGYTWAYPLHVWLKRAVFDRTYLGSPAVHRRRSAELAGWLAA